tara:strand:- start:140 stop:1318 length:1179 start_codon:yes stop_codon:yes gene_type:complete
MANEPKKGTGKKPKGSSRRLYTDENPKDTVSVKFSSRQDIVDTLGKASFKSKPHARQSQIINLIHQRVRAAYGRAKDPAVKKRLKTALDYAEQRKEASKRKTQSMKKEAINESGYDEAWELLGQPVPEIQKFVKDLGFQNDDATAKKVGAIIDNVKDASLAANKIPNLKNLANKGNDAETLEAIKQISGKPNAEQQYVKLMQARDAGEKRKRNYDVSDLIKSVKSGNYESPVLLQLPSGLYVIGGRTRLYAALALGISAKVKIINHDTFKQKAMNENIDPKSQAKHKGKSAPYGSAYELVKELVLQELQLVKELKCKYGTYFCNHDKVYKCRKGPKKSRSNEGVHDPMNPGILKKRLGNLSCSKVRAARGKLKDKGTTYAKALQRYLNYHCQ